MRLRGRRNMRPQTAHRRVLYRFKRVQRRQHNLFAARRTRFQNMRHRALTLRRRFILPVKQRRRGQFLSAPPQEPPTKFFVGGAFFQVIVNFIVCLVFRLLNMVQRNAVPFRLPLSLSFRPSEASGEIYQYRKFFQYRKPYAIMRDFSMRRRPIRAGGLVEMT